MCITALPDHLNSQEEIDSNFPDDSQYSGLFGRLYRGFHKRTKAMTAFGPRDVHWYHRWREYPVTLLAVRGPFTWRFETNTGDFVFGNFTRWFTIFNRKLAREPHYLSRVQYYNDWHIALQWPLFLHGHVSGWQFYVGCKRDGDRVYWAPSIYVGRTWK